MNKYKILKDQYIEVCGTKYEAEYMALIQLARLREKEWLDETD